MPSLLKKYKQKNLRKYIRTEDIHPSVLNYLLAIEQIDLNIGIDEATYIVLDTELTGLNIKRDSIVSIGAIKMLGGRIDLSNIYYRVVNPKAQLTGQSIVVHGITPSEASVCPNIDIIIPEFLDFCRNGTFIGHFISIDYAFINKEMKKVIGFPLQNHAIDTQHIYKWIRKHEDSHCAFYAGLTEDTDLLSMANKYSIPVSNMHNAIVDAFITAQLFQRFIKLMPKYGVKTLRDFIRIN